ncbi:hypothetical protein M407DRAFT_12699 [Tulasnella calospora MUT 4182]|uniref:Uncharacterized protein n=1 Tax=Tulasnella calospora MUT 4182 TaxID=1051891 RepID=A0A0C3L4X7_9AGAM|nr:hypothetical protein M407DRAFT_12699 [Tulasnella calospora MUT 4182]
MKIDWRSILKRLGRVGECGEAALAGRPGLRTLEPPSGSLVETRQIVFRLHILVNNLSSMSSKHKKRDNTQLVYDPSNPAATPVRVKKRRGPYKKRTAESSAADDPSQESSRRQEASSNTGQSSKRRKRAVSPEWQPGLVFRAAAGARLIPGASGINEQSQEDNESDQAAVDGVDELEPALPDPLLAGALGAEVGATAQPASRKRKSNAKREAKKEAYPRWKDVVLPSVTIPFLQAEALRAEGKPLRPLPSENSPLAQGFQSIVGEKCPNPLQCGKTLRQSVVQSAFVIEERWFAETVAQCPEPFSAQLPEAMDWYNVLKRRVETMMYNVLSQAETEAAEADESRAGSPEPQIVSAARSNRLDSRALIDSMHL